MNLKKTLVREQKKMDLVPKQRLELFFVLDLKKSDHFSCLGMLLSASFWQISKKFSRFEHSKAINQSQCS